MIEITPRLEVFKASAGSGKTHQLTLRYISFLLGKRIDDTEKIRLYTAEERKKHREILAITFTNKATEEMKQRIVYELYCLADVNRESKMRDALLTLCGVTAERLAQAAKDALMQLLYDFGEMQVSTIDAFFQKILRSFAYEADLGGNYDLMVDSKQMIDMAIVDTLSLICDMRVNSDYDRGRVEMIRRWVKNLLYAQASNNGDIKIFDQNNSIRTTLSKFISKLSDETYQNIKSELDSFLSDDGAIDSLIDELQISREYHHKEIRECVKSLKCFYGDKLKSTTLKMLDKIQSGAYESLTPTNIQYVSQERADYDNLFLKNKSDATGIIYITQMFGLIQRLYTIDTMLDQIFYLGLFREVLNIASRMKVHLNTILLSDTNTLLNEIIADSDTPFIYERTGQRIHHYLIDEFQDTSLLQWKNLYPLIVNSIGTGYDNMIIGDVKQCIYRFRNSYPELLDYELQNDTAFRNVITLPVLEENRRSSHVIVEFNNELFERIADKHNLSAYNQVSQKAYNNSPGYVDLSICKNFEEENNLRIVEHIRRQIDSGYKAGSIAVLVRKRSHAKQIIDLLLEASKPGGQLEGIQVLSDEALYVSSSKAVGYIISQLRLLDRVQRDPDSIPVSSKTGLPKTTEHELDWLREQLQSMQSDGIHGTSAIEAILSDFDARNHLAARNKEEEDAWRRKTRGRSVFEVVEELLITLPDDSLRYSEAQYISAFQDLVVEYCRVGSPSIHGFLKLWDEQLDEKAAIGLPSNSDAIRVMTIHKSKGLQFDCVHVPLFGEKLQQENNYRWYKSAEILHTLGINGTLPPYFPLHSSSGLKKTLFAEQYESLCSEQFLDQLNVMYVAFTRAKSELIVTADASAGTAGSLIIEALDASGNSEDMFTYQVGQYTQVDSMADKFAHNDQYTLNLDAYKVYNRLDIWHSSKPVEESDSGELI